MISVGLDCSPPILNAVLTGALSDLPNVTLVYSVDTIPDVVIMSIGDDVDNPLGWTTAVGPGRTNIGLDSLNNILRVRRGDNKRTGERILTGTLLKLRQVLRELSRPESNDLAPAQAKLGA